MSDSFSTELFRVRSRSGKTMKGIAFLPASRRRGAPGLVYLPGIVLGATAMHRLGIELAMHLAESGYPTCLVDQIGIGDSQGEYTEGTHRDLSAWVESGGLVEDTVRAIAEFRRRCEVDSVALIGHCGGALTAGYVLAETRVTAALLLSPPTVAVATRDEFAGKLVVDQHLGLYLAKLTDVQAWKRMLAGHSDYRTLVRLARRKLEQELRSVTARLRKLRARLGAADSGSRPASEPAGPSRRFNPRFERALSSAKSSRTRIRVVFGERDPEVDDFRAFAERHPGLSHVILPETSHGFVTEESLGLLFQEVDAFAAAATGDHP